jgi:hypothetical protein
MEIFADLQRIIDEAAITRLIVDLASAQDRLDADVMAASYHDDAIDNHGVLGAKPASELIPWAMESLPKLFSATSHNVGAIRIALDGDVASTETRIDHVHVYHPDADGRVKIGRGGGRYIDKIERRDGNTWKIADRLLVHDWSYVVEDTRPEFDMSGSQGRRGKSDPSYFGVDTPLAQ